MKATRPAKTTNGAAPSSPVKPKFPKFPLEEALAVPRALQRNGGQPLPPIDTATALNRSPGSSAFQVITGSAHQYGLIGGSYKSDYFTLEGLGRGIVEPTEAGEDARSLVIAALRPPLFRALYEYYRGKRFPEKQFFINTVKREFKVPEANAEQCVDVFTANMRFVALLRDTPGGAWLSKEATPQPEPGAAAATQEETASPGEAFQEFGTTTEGTVEEHEGPPTSPAHAERQGRPNRMLLGHGGREKPLTQLKGMLDQLGIPYSVAKTEPNLNRPIPTKVRETMEQCGAAILIFSADREYFDKAGEPIWKSSENVAHELGAAAVMYDDRVIIFKEDSVELASNYSGVGYIEFEKDKLDSKMPDLLRELMAMKILRMEVND